MHALPLLASAIAIIGNAVPIDDWKDNQEYARMVKDIGVDNYAAHLGLHGEQKQIFDDLVGSFAKEEISLQELLQKMEKATPAAYRTLSALLEDYRTRVAAVQSEEAREYLLEAERALLDIPLAMTLYKEGLISLEDRNTRIVSAMIQTSFMLLKTRLPARREIVGLFPEAMPYLVVAGVRPHKLLTQ
ncbi:hypothetical protein PRIPAC_78089 [Pristionchus pacificus]|uniref:Uncharacterized protein n=1 Tax=Pristionchus pacificus TaxID=54126 RepID=A0A2A6CLL8_PRIPA|nr:hypothetical protein PRIPAC_78089 [Pristionchus pacificus]|eukprot:PDM79104.1 hypothetical protein PRIPAC_31683 [Pristionchus pacificus]